MGASLRRGVARLGRSRRLFGVRGGQAAQAQGKTIVLAVEGEPSRLDPHTHVLWLTYRETFHIYESFVQQDLTIRDVERPPVIPALATSWDISEDKLHYTFHLREGVTFHDGTPWNADVAKFNFDRVMNEDFEHFYPLANSFNGWWHGDIESYEVVMSTPSWST